MKRLISIMLLAAIVFVVSAGCGKIVHISHKFENGVLTLSGNGVISEKDYGISESITKIIIEDGITGIGKDAFRGFADLTEVQIPYSVKTIADYAFQNCDKLEKLIIKNTEGSVTFGKSAVPETATVVWKFTDADTTVPEDTATPDDTTEAVPKGQITWDLSGDTLTISGNGPMNDYESYSDVPWYDNITQIEIVKIEDGVTSIGNSAFANHESLTSVSIPDNVTSIGDWAFSDCYSLTSVTIPDSVTSIGDYAFSYCESLTSVSIPNGVTSIGDDAFIYCTSLISVKLEANATLDSNIFLGCDNIIDFQVGSNYKFESGILYNKDKTALIACIDTDIKTVTVPDSLTSIGDWAFSNCESLTSITFSNSVTSIGDDAFNNCSNLTSVTIPDSVTSIGHHAFNRCSNLKSVTLPDSITTIGYRTFAYCYNLTSITIPNSVTSIGDYALGWCENLTSVSIPDSVTSIGEAAFYDCTNLTSVTIQNKKGAVSIGDDAFPDTCTVTYTG